MLFAASTFSYGHPLVLSIAATDISLDLLKQHKQNSVFSALRDCVVNSRNIENVDWVEHVDDTMMVITTSAGARSLRRPWNSLNII